MNLNENASRYDHVHGDEDEGPEIAPEELIAARDELADDILRAQAWKLGLAIEWTDPEALAVKLCAAFADKDALPNLRDECHQLLCDWLEVQHEDWIAEKALAMRKEEGE